MRLNIEPNHYYRNYDSQERFCSYWHQIDEIISNNPKNILEIGIGNRFVSRYLKHMEHNILTLDLDKRLNSDFVASVLKIPFSNELFDLVACYEVLEHLPFECFKKAISEIFRVSSSRAVLSLPDANRFYRIYIQVPRIGVIKRIIEIPRLRKLIHTFNGEHYWEIGKVGYSLETIVNAIIEAGFKIEKTYRPFEVPCHRFFILTKR